MNKLLIIVFLSLLCFACSKKNLNKNLIGQKELDSQVFEAYQKGIEYLENGDALYAAKKFNEAEILFPQSIWAPKSALMASYSYYSQDYYEDTIAELKRFIKIYPKHKNLDYAYFLLATSYYEKIVDEKKDLQSIINAKTNYNIVKNNFPNTDYALDAEFKLDLINDILASKEMYIGRYYLEKKKWIPAINRFKTIIDDYDTTIYTEEALHRLVEVYYILGLEKEAKNYANLLGYNYQSSIWYEKNYVIFDKKYKKIKKEKQKKISRLKKIKSLFE